MAGATRKPGEKRRRHLEDVDDFRRRAEWFWQTRVRNPDVAVGTIRQTAIRHAETLQRFDPFSVAVEGDALARGAELLLGGTGKPRSRTLKPARNPDERGAPTFASRIFEVGEEHDLRDAYISVPLDEALTKTVLVDSVRLFRWNFLCLRWILVSISAVAASKSFTWGRVHRPGVYAAIGLPRDEERIRRLVELYRLRPLLFALDEEGREELAEAVDASDLRSLLQRFHDDPDVVPVLPQITRSRTARGPKPARPGGLPPLPPLPQGGPPELDLLDDICPPYRGPSSNWYVPIDLGSFFGPGFPFFPRDWVSAGPSNFSGRIKSVAVDPGNGNVVYAGAADGGVWKTLDAGASWRPLMRHELSLAIGSVAVAPGDRNVVYAATGEDTPGWGPSYPGVGVYRSSDGGSSWTLTTGMGDRCSRVVVDPWNADLAYVATNWGVYKTANGGTTWTQSLAGHATDILVDPNNPTRLFAGIWNDGVYVSTNAGASWSRSGLGLPVHFKWITFWVGRLPTGTAADWIKLAMGHHGADGTSFLAAKMGPDSGTIYTTTDGGFTWFPLAGSHEAASYNEWTNLVAIHPNDAGVLFAGGVGLQRATDGQTFGGVGGTHSDHHVIDFDRGISTRAFMATDGGVYRSTDSGASWTLRSTGLTATQFYSCGVSQSGAFLLGGATQDQGILATTGSTSWTDTGAGNEGGIFVVDPNDSRNVYTTPWSNDLRRSRDSGATWQDIRSGMTASVGGTTTPPAGIAHVAVRPAASSTLVAVGVISNSTGYRSARIFRSTNQGDSWTSRATITGDGTRAEFCWAEDAVCYVTTTDGRVYKSTNGGSSWTEPYASGKPSPNPLSALAVFRHESDIAYVGCGGYSGARVLRTLDGGATWSDVSGTGAGTLPALPVNSLVIDSCDEDLVYLANDIGVFRTTDGGVSWHDFGDGFLFWDVPRIVVTELQLRRSTKTLYASTMGRGMFRRAL